jgi:hypothetical protein
MTMIADYMREPPEEPKMSMEDQRDAALALAYERLRCWNEANKRVRALLEALEPFAEAASHLHPSQPDDGLTLDGIEVRHWRAAAQAVAMAKAH